MKSIRAPLLWLAAATCGLAAGHAAADEPPAQQRARIAAARQAIQKRYDAQERDCSQRFVVTSCMNTARKERRDALAPLRQQELRIDSDERKQRAADRLDEIEEKRRADSAKEAAKEATRETTRETAKPAASAPEPARASRAAAAPDRPASPIVRPSAKTALAPAERERREAVSQARFEANQVEAQQRRQAAEARNARRAASGKVARPLPPASGGSSP